MIIVVMGVAGAGKTTVGTLLAQQLGWEFADADAFHSAQNIEKIRRGIPLTDEDRAPWLTALREAIRRWIAAKKNVVLACSALKQTYRKHLCAGPEVKIVYLKGDYDLIFRRLEHRKGHFATGQVLASQFGDLEEPTHAVVVEINHSPAELVAEIRARLGLNSA